jgi:hypothetical protein
MGLSWQQGPLAPGAVGRFLVPGPLPDRMLFAEPLRAASRRRGAHLLRPAQRGRRTGHVKARAGWLAVGGFGGEQATVVRLAHGGGAVTDAELCVDVHQVGT